MKTLAVHPAVMKRIQSGNVCNIVTRYEFKESEPVEVITDDEGIVCVAGVGVSDRAKPREPGATRIRIHIRKAGPIE